MMKPSRSSISVSSPSPLAYNFNIVGTDPASASHSQAATFTTVDFTTSSATAPQTVKAGVSAAYVVTFTPVGGNFANDLTLACTTGRKGLAGALRATAGLAPKR